MSDTPVTAAAEVDQDRRGFLTFATVATGAVGAAFVAVPFIASWSPSERARAAGAPVEVDLAKIEPGQMLTIPYRKKPMYIVHRTPEMLGHLAGHDAKLKDPESKDSEQPDYARNAQRAVKPEFLVLEGTCTHLGCLPTTAVRTARHYTLTFRSPLPQYSCPPAASSATPCSSVAPSPPASPFHC